MGEDNWMGEDNSLAATAPLPAAEWHFVAATFDGVRVHLYSGGQEVASGKPALGRVSPNVEMAPEDLPWKGAQHFGGRIAALTLLRTTLTDAEVRLLSTQVPNPSDRIRRGLKAMADPDQGTSGLQSAAGSIFFAAQRRTFFRSRRATSSALPLLFTTAR